MLGISSELQAHQLLQYLNVDSMHLCDRLLISTADLGSP
jgi:hypothetical protein